MMQQLGNNFGETKATSWNLFGANSNNVHKPKAHIFLSCNLKNNSLNLIIRNFFLSYILLP